MVRKTGIYVISNSIQQTELSENENPATFEEAISAAGFGKFNYLLLLVTLPATVATMITAFNTAFVIPALQCEFNLSIMDIGILIASPFVGNFPGAFFWGYLADTMGRKKLMVYATFLDAVANIFCAFSFNMWMVAFLKFISGFIIQGPTAILMSYLSECFSDKHRSIVILISGIFIGVVNLILPLLAWGILPLKMNYLQPWQVFLILCTIPAIITGFCFMFLPESPKFLMMIKKHDEALDIFQEIYSMNTGQSKEYYPITKLQCENTMNQNDEKETEPSKKISGWQQVKPLFLPPYLWKLTLTLMMQFLILLGANTLKTWLPELFSMMDEFDSTNNKDATICDMISVHLNTSTANNTNFTGGICIASQTNDQVYINLCLVGICSIVLYIIVTIAISIMNKKMLLALLLFISGSCGIALIWCTNPIIIIFISALYSTMTGIACMTFVSITVDLFPTSFRTLTVSLSLTVGRLGGVTGNLVFPALLVLGCFPPFFFLGGSILDIYSTGDKNEPLKNENPATFEEAISAAGFGKFNYLLLLISLPGSVAIMITVFNTAFVIPALQCEFNLSIMDIGILIASPFIGNLPGAFFWGYLSDTMGRKKLMIYATLSDVACNIICAFSVNMWMVVILKFISGFVIQGPTAILMAYLSECFNDQHRSKIIMISGIFMGFVNLILPLLAWGILPMQMSFLQPWQVFLLVCTIPGVITGFSFMILPESPKFLMMMKKHDEALRIFQNIFRMNTGQPKEYYPITKLQCESIINQNIEKETGTSKKMSGWQQIKPLFFPPYLWKFILTLLMQFFILLGANTLKTWLPELFSMMDGYDSINNEKATICDMISGHLNTTTVNNSHSTDTDGICIAGQTNDQVYINLCMVGICSVAMYTIVTIGISFINKKLLLGILLFVSGSCGIALIWCTDPIIMLLITALYSTMTGVACVAFISITVDLFPTSFRTLTVSLSLTIGRMGSVIGNLVFPALLILGCFPPFFFLGGSILACIIPLLLLSSSKTEDI